MIELVQFPWSPFCLVQRRILEFSGQPFKIVNIPYGDPALVWKLTRQRYYSVPIITDGKTVVFETGEESQVIAKYLDAKFELGLFPRELAGLQNILWRYIESDIEGLTFKLNDIYYKEMVPEAGRLLFLRHKERKFGRGCVDEWRRNKTAMVKQLGEKLLPFEQMLMTRPFLLDARPRFVDFDLYGMLSNYLYSGHFKLHARHTRLREWYGRMGKLKFAGGEGPKS